MSSLGPTLPKSGKESRAAKNAMTAPAIGTTTATRTTNAMTPPISLPLFAPAEARCATSTEDADPGP